MVEPKADLYPAMRASREYWDERHEAELTALRAERDALRLALESHNAECTAACASREEAGRCDAYLARGRTCVDCPRDDMILLPVLSAGASNTEFQPMANELTPDYYLPLQVCEIPDASRLEFEVWTAGDDGFQVAVCADREIAEAIAHYGREILERARASAASVHTPVSTNAPKGAVSVMNPQGTEETGTDRPAAPVLVLARCDYCGVERELLDCGDIRCTNTSFNGFFDEECGGLMEPVPRQGTSHG